MKPQELLTKNIDLYLKNELKLLGFQYIKSSTSFKRSYNGFTQKITICSSRYNSKNLCEFWTMWSVCSNTFKKWYKDNYGVNPVNSCVWDIAEWNIEGWQDFLSSKTQLLNNHSDNKKMQNFTNAFLNLGIPLLNKFSNFEECIESDLINGPLVKTKLINLLLLLTNQNTLANEKLIYYINQIESKKLTDELCELEELKEMLKSLVL